MYEHVHTTPECSKVAERLYQGSVPLPSGAVARAGFTLLVLAAQEYQFPPSASRQFGIPVVHAPIDDSELTEGEWRRAVSAARVVAVRHRAGAKVLVTCAAGLNRSGLVTALSIHLLTGCSGASAVRLVRERRENALFNRSFVRRLKKLRPLLRLDPAAHYG